ncbi:hypothetical protein AAF712_013721 [Marasmius tenuissimus]|uniref:Elongin-A n=1 Tax=Marasmius tenuissimus TaxID=585030 RepID=A0ABR2ZDV2_9AGAR|nr:hypothetical protein PM082_013272 [Marasmius tenuissimus]
MASEGDTLNRGVGSLVHLCQRVAVKHVDSITSLGDMNYDLVKPILEGCSAETLLRLEKASPHLQEDTQELWRTLCSKRFPVVTERYREGESSAPKSWRNHYYTLLKEEEQRLDAIGSKIRSQRLEADEGKKGREVKYIDRAPPLKRARWGPQPPKTLFQKTRSEASKIQKTMYTSRMIPPMPKGRDYRSSVSPAVGDLLPKPSPSYTNRVTVNTVIRRQSVSSAASTTSAAAAPVGGPPLQTNPKITSTTSQLTHTSGTTTSCHKPIDESHAHNKTPESPSPASTQFPPHLKPPNPMKKDLMATLFVPKHKAYSQRTK